MTADQCPFSVSSFAVLESSFLNFSKFFGITYRCLSPIRSSAIFLWSTPSNFFKFFATSDQYHILMRSSANSESSPSNFSRFCATSRPIPFLIESSAIFLWSTPSNFSKLFMTADQCPFSVSSFAISELSPSNFSKFLATAL